MNNRFVRNTCVIMALTISFMNFSSIKPLSVQAEESSDYFPYSTGNSGSITIKTAANDAASSTTTNGGSSQGNSSTGDVASGDSSANDGTTGIDTDGTAETTNSGASSGSATGGNSAISDNTSTANGTTTDSDESSSNRSQNNADATVDKDLNNEDELIEEEESLDMAEESQLDEATSYAKSGNTVNQGTDPSYIFIGDSRTVGMCTYVEDNDYIWSAKSSSGLSWMKSTGVPAVEDKIEEGSAVVIMMGVNDAYSTKLAEKYADYLNEKAEEWKEIGAEVYFVSVNPITKSSVGSGAITNAKIEAWNETIQENISDNVNYLDTYSVLKGKLNSSDGLHYYKEDCQLIYDTIMEMIEGNDEDAEIIESFKTKIKSAEIDSKKGTVSFELTAPENVKNPQFQIQQYKDGKWQNVLKTSSLNVSFKTEDKEVKVRARVFKTIGKQVVDGKWSKELIISSKDEPWWVRLFNWFKNLFS
ncbi:MAG: hypothetical protein K6B67_09490 [Lachnospiraceae bacterium]|nr:hypothetical protein [Lachnospiraceae bacterium]